jgi:predicted nucleic acid-binding protein
MISFDTYVLIYATAARLDEKANRARDLLGRAMASSDQRTPAPEPCGV